MRASKRDSNPSICKTMKTMSNTSQTVVTTQTANRNATPINARIDISTNHPKLNSMTNDCNTADQTEPIDCNQHENQQRNASSAKERTAGQHAIHRKSGTKLEKSIQPHSTRNSTTGLTNTWQTMQKERTIGAMIFPTNSWMILKHL